MKISKMILGFIIISAYFFISGVLFQNCSGEGMQSISSEQSSYFNSSLNPNALSQFSTLEDAHLVKRAQKYSDAKNRIKYVIVAPSKFGKIISFNEVTAEFEYAPNADVNGSDFFEVAAVLDGYNSSLPYRVDIEITPVNDAPIGQNMNLIANEDTPTSGQLLVRDIENSPLTYTMSVAPQKGTVVLGANGSYTYTPFLNANGADVFKFKVSDGELTSAEATVTIMVNPVNDLPTASNGNLNTNEGVAVNGQLAAQDVDGDTLTYQIVTQPTNGSIQNLNDNTGSFIFVPVANNNGLNLTDSFTFKVKDAVGFSSVATVSINLDNINDAPVAQNINLTTNEDTAASARLVATDADNDVVTFVITSQPQKGVVQGFNGATGTFTYIPNSDVNGSDSFQFIAKDSSLSSVAKNVVITINPINDAPVSQNVTVPAVNEDTAIDADAIASDVDGDTLVYFVVDQPGHGFVTFNGKRFHYVPELNFNGSDKFTYKANDGSLDSNVSQVSISLIPVNDAPVARDGTVQTKENTALNYDVIATDAEGDSLTYEVLAQPAYGYAEFVLGRTLYYASAFGYSGDDSLTYRVSDGHSYSNTATVTIKIMSVIQELPVFAPSPMDIDFNGVVDSKDSILITRYLFGFTGTALIADQISASSQRSSAGEIENYLANLKQAGILDVDKNGTSDALTDGILINRYILGYRGAQLVDGATLAPASQIEAYLSQYIY